MKSVNLESFQVEVKRNRG